MRLSIPVLLFTVATVIGSGILFGCAPAWQAIHSNLSENLKQGAGGTTGGRHRVQRALMVAEFALALTLLAGGGLAIHSLMNLSRVDLGFRTERLLTLFLPVPNERLKGAERVTLFYDQLEEKLGALPGVEAVTIATGGPLRGGFGMAVDILGRPGAQGSARDSAAFIMATPDYPAPAADARNAPGVTLNHFGAVATRSLRADRRAKMRSMRIFGLSLAGTLAALPGLTIPARAPAPGAVSPPAALLVLADDYWAAYVERYPEVATYQGIASAPHDRLTDNSLAAGAAWSAREDAWRLRLRALVPQLDPASGEATVAAILDNTLTSAVATRVCRTELWNLSDTWPGWQGFLADWTAAQPVGDETARRRAVARWRAMPRFIGAEIANLKEGLRLGYTAPRSTAEAVLKQVDALLATPAAQSPWLEPARRDGDPRFAAALAAVVEGEITPALVRFRDFLAREYLPAAREAVGAAAMPDGERCYGASVRAHTTVEIPARAIHELGLAEMAKLQLEMKAIAERSFGTSDVPALLERLRTDPAYTYRSKEDLTAHLTAAVARARAAMPKWFGLLPKADVVLEPHQSFREPASDLYNGPSEDGSRPGVYLYSTWEPTKKSRSGPESTAFHETIPGHHLQSAIALERAQAHPLQRFGVYDAALRYNGAFGEGWALYSERLADEMGLFSGDLDRLGMLSAMSYRAARLVVDPGLHVLGWSRGRAIDYLMAHTTVARSEAESEIDRYIAWPGQATSYYLGYLEIARLRAEARRRLGPRFDIRAFHDRVLEGGALPMPALGARIERWIAGVEAARNR